MGSGARQTSPLEAKIEPVVRTACSHRLRRGESGVYDAKKEAPGTTGEVVPGAGSTEAEQGLGDFYWSAMHLPIAALQSADVVSLFAPHTSAGFSRSTDAAFTFITHF